MRGGKRNREEDGGVFRKTASATVTANLARRGSVRQSKQTSMSLAVHTPDKDMLSDVVTTLCSTRDSMDSTARSMEELHRKTVEAYLAMDSRLSLCEQHMHSPAAVTVPAISTLSTESVLAARLRAMPVERVAPPPLSVRVRAPVPVERLVLDERADPANDSNLVTNTESDFLTELKQRISRRACCNYEV